MSDVFFQYVLNGLVAGGVYCLVALGLTLVFGILAVPQFAHGDVYMFGGYTALVAVTVVGLGYWPAVILTIIVMAGFSMLLEWVVFRRFIAAPLLNAFIAAIGLIYIIENGALLIFGPMIKSFPSLYPQVLHILGTNITLQRLIILAAAVVLIILLELFIKRTNIGATIEAVAQNREAAQLVGININRVRLLTFALAGGLAGAAGALIGPTVLVYNTMGAHLILKAYIIIILGGIGSIPGAIVGGFVVGLVESLSMGYITTSYSEAIAFAILILVLAIRPTGLFGAKA